MLRRLFYKPGATEIRPDGTRVQKWERRSLRAWLIMKLVGKRAVLANQPIRTKLALHVTADGYMVFGNTLYDEGELHIIRDR